MRLAVGGWSRLETTTDSCCCWRRRDQAEWAGSKGRIESGGGDLRRGATSRPGTDTDGVAWRAEAIGTDCRILLGGWRGGAGVIFDDAEKGASVVPKMGREKKDDGSTDRSDEVVDCFDRSFEARDGSDGLGWVGVCVWQMEELRGRVFTSWVPGLEDGMNVWRRETASPDRNRCQKNELGLVRAPLSLFFVRPASSQLHFPGSQHRFPISFQINLPGPFSPRRNGLSTFCQHTRKSTRRLVPLSAVLAGQTKPTITQLTRHPTCHRFHCHFAKGRAIPATDRYGRKKGARGQDGAVGLAGGFAHATQLLDVVGLSIADGRGQDLLSSQLFAFPPSPTATAVTPGKLRHHQLSPLPQQHPFVEGCTSTRRVHNVVSRGGGTMSAYCLLAT